MGKAGRLYTLMKSTFVVKREILKEVKKCGSCMRKYIQYKGTLTCSLRILNKFTVNNLPRSNTTCGKNIRLNAM